jgi:hypothetical protein
MPYQRCTATGGDHEHVAYVDPRTLNGRADPGPDGHEHEIVRGVVEAGGHDGHTHVLTCEPEAA